MIDLELFAHESCDGTSDLYHYEDSGLPNIYLSGGVVREKTPYGWATSIADLDTLHLAIGTRIARRPDDMTGAEFRFLRVELDMSQAALSRLLGESVQCLHRWENDKSKVPGAAARLLGVLYLEASNGESRTGDVLRRYVELDREMDHGADVVFEKAGEEWRPTAA